MTSPEAAQASPFDVEVSECRLDSDADIALADAWALLDDSERTRAHSFVFEDDREAFVRSHGFLRRQLGDVLGLAPEHVPIVAEEGKKPFVSDHGVQFNLSHSGPLAVLAIGRGREIGIDLEILGQAIKLDEHFDGLVEMVLTPAEQNAITSTPDDRKIRRFLSYWTAKEARMKLTGEGMALDPKAIFLDLVDAEPVGYRRPMTPRADLRFIDLSRQDAVCCLAIARDGAAVRS